MAVLTQLGTVAKDDAAYADAVALDDGAVAGGVDEVDVVQGVLAKRRSRGPRLAQVELLLDAVKTIKRHRPGQRDRRLRGRNADDVDRPLTGRVDGVAQQGKDLLRGEGTAFSGQGASSLSAKSPTSASSNARRM